MLQPNHAQDMQADFKAPKIRRQSLRDLLQTLGGSEKLSPSHGYGRIGSERNFAKEMDTYFDHFQRAFGSPFKAWAANAFGGHSYIQTLFYPFGGADFCFPYYLLPKARDYILVGREPCSLWPLGESSARLALDEIVEVLRHYLQFSYFITKDLQRSLDSDGVRGVLPLILAQMVRCGLPILSVQPIGPNCEGLRIEFGDRRAPQRLHYYRQDLRDAHWPQSCDLNRLLMASSGLAVFVKSGSYLLHEPAFERLRHIIRDRASLLVQDPSGIPYYVLQNWRWGANLHGRFTSDIPVFSNYDQSSLVQAYSASNYEAPLDFGIGYLTAPASSSLVVASPRKLKFTS